MQNTDFATFSRDTQLALFSFYHGKHFISLAFSPIKFLLVIQLPYSTIEVAPKSDTNAKFSKIYIFQPLKIDPVKCTFPLVGITYNSWLDMEWLHPSLSILHTFLMQLNFFQNKLLKNCCTALHWSIQQLNTDKKITIRACDFCNSSFCLLASTSSLLTSRFLIAFCAAALVAMRRPSAASRNFCCCSSLSGFAAAPWGEMHAGHYSLN